MNRLVTYTIAGTVGLLIAALLSIPTITSMRRWKLTRPDPPPAVVEVAQPEDAQKPPAENQTMLTTNLSVGSLTVTVNGAAAGSVQGSVQMDITRFCHPGANIVRMIWVGQTDGNVTINHTIAGSTRSVADAFFVAAGTGSPGVRDLPFYL